MAPRKSTRGQGRRPRGEEPDDRLAEAGPADHEAVAQGDLRETAEYAEDIGLDEFDTVRQLVPDPRDVPELFVMQGWIGRSARENVWRLYQNHSLTEWYEIHQRDIVWTEFIDAYEGVKRVWVRRGAIMRHVEQNQQPAEVDYLSGPIAEQAKLAAEANYRVHGLGGPEPRSGCPGCGSKGSP